MPTKPMPPCRWPGCPNVQVPGGHGYCREHLREYHKKERARRGGTYERGYDKRYKKARAWVLKHNPLCVVCKMEGRLTAATVTHHIRPLAEGGSNRTNNLLAVCQSCHDRLHGKHGPELMEKLRERMLGVFSDSSGGVAGGGGSL